MSREADSPWKHREPPPGPRAGGADPHTDWTEGNLGKWTPLGIWVAGSRPDGCMRSKRPDATPYILCTWLTPFSFQVGRECSSTGRRYCFPCRLRIPGPVRLSPKEMNNPAFRVYPSVSAVGEDSWMCWQSLAETLVTLVSTTPHRDFSQVGTNVDVVTVLFVF